MAEEKVVGINGNAGAFKVRNTLAGEFGQLMNRFEEQGAVPTGAVWIVFDDAGSFRAGWNTDNCALPAGACLGVAISSLMRAMQDYCNHD